MTARTAAALALAALIVPAAAFADQLRTFSDLAAFVVNILNSGTALLVLAGVVIYFGGVTTNLFKLKKGDPTALREYLLWGIAILFVMVSIWGIVALVRDTLFGAGGPGQVGGGAPASSGGSPFAPPQFTE